MHKHPDILIIGGGIAGIGAAARLAPVAKVTVLEAETVLAYHSTGRSAAFFIRNYGNATLRKINVASEPELVSPEGISDSSLLSPRGLLMISTEAEMESFEAYLDDAQNMERITPAQAGNLIPILNTDRLAAAAVENSAQEIDVDRLFQGFLRLAVSEGAEIIKQAKVTGLSRNADIWRIETPQGKFEAPIVINAAGAWADEIAQLAGLDPMGLQPCRRSAAIIPAPDGYDINAWPLLLSASENFYAKPQSGQLLVSPADEDPVDPHDVWPEDLVLAEGLHRFEQVVTVPVTRLVHSWAGLRTFAPDRTPIVGFDPRSKGFFWLAGQGGYGIQTAPALSRLCRNLITETPPELTEQVVTALSPARLINRN